MSKQHDLIVMGDINLDWYALEHLPFRFSDLLVNGIIEWKRIAELPGGSGLNFACFAQEIGYRPLLLGKIGADPSGQFIYSWLEKRFLERGLIVDDQLSTGKAFIVRDAHDIRFLVNNTPNANRALSVADIEHYSDAIMGCQLLYISGYCMMEPAAPRAQATLRAMGLANSNPKVSIVFDVVPHQFYRIYTEFSQFLEITKQVDILVSEVSTMRRFLKLGDRDEIITPALAEETVEELKPFYNRFVLRYGPSGCDEQVIYDGQSKRLLWETTQHSSVQDKRGYGDRLLLKTLREVFDLGPETNLDEYHEVGKLA